LTGARGRPRRIITSIYLDPQVLHNYNVHLQEKHRLIEQNEVRFSEFMLDDAEYAIVAFGSAARAAHSAVRLARAKGIRAGLFRPISLYPYPYARLAEITRRVRALLVVEMNAGQMIEDVRLAAADRVPIRFFGRMGGLVPFPEEVLEEIEKMVEAK
jgi:2-oxoglutarate ferredoxin oxidoreductase subunit alpha